MFSCNGSLSSYLGGTVVDWQVRTTKKGVTIHPLSVTMENGRLIKGDTCKCDTSGYDDRKEMMSDLPQSTSVRKHQRLGRDGNQPVIHEYEVAGDRGYQMVVIHVA